MSFAAYAGKKDVGLPVLVRLKCFAERKNDTCEVQTSDKLEYKEKQNEYENDSSRQSQDLRFEMRRYHWRARFGLFAAKGAFADFSGFKIHLLFN
jgi:hypothetical protein